ncbi:putative sesquiterpene cyclase protein [Botrytis fragariae]|uniref:Putative sesquiterpene cyclase protein n=1 Tax=Botrytis fragariae TaxID=1964551 RepID=A0A8H6B4U3_9HELO|nr:putative sesquiterpene cyclase protein [Botrytis fragariae]KAF5879411.1 putative sesquiterpene cyclase protein [Botrytis fragariae]
METYESLLLDTNPNTLEKQEQVATIVQKKQEILESKQWSIKISGKSLKVKDQVKRIMEAFKKVKEFGAALASIDPIHAGFPWDGVSLLLSVIRQFINIYDSKFHLRCCILSLQHAGPELSGVYVTNTDIFMLASNDFEQNEALLEGLEKLSDIIARYTEVESVYLNTAVAGDLDIQLELRVIKLYTCILKFQATAACYLSYSTLERLMRNLPKLDDWSKLLTEVTSEDENCYRWGSLQDSRVLRKLYEHINPLVSIQPLTILPSYFEVPTGRKIPHLIGRGEMSARIDSAHSRSSSSKAGIVVLRGLGGQGKTQIALEYCHISRNKFKAVFWVDASSESSVIRSFETIYARIKGPGNDCGSGDTKLDFVKNAIRTWNFRWLITFDNYDTPDTLSLEDYIPHSVHGSVLVTTRHKDVDALVEDTAAAIELLGLPDKEALQLLYQQSGTEENEANKINGLNIVKRLGYHAFAVTQAATYIKNLKLDFSSFVSHYSRRREEILKYKIPMNKYTKLLSEFEKETAFNVFTTWELSFDELKAQHDSTDLDQLLTILAFFDPLDISEELFSTYMREAGVWDRDAFADALQILESLSLIQSFYASTNGEYHISLHPLVKDWIRLRTEDTLCEEYTVLVAEMIAGQVMINFPVMDFFHANAHEENIGYVTTPNAVEGSYDEFSNKRSMYESFYSSEWLMCTGLDFMGYYEKAKSSLAFKEKMQDMLSRRGMKEEALSTSTQLYKLHSRMYGEEHEQTLQSKGILSRRLKEIGERVKLSGEAHATTLKSKIKLAELLEKTTQTEEANKLCTEILSFMNSWTILNGDPIELTFDLESTLRNLHRCDDCLALIRYKLKLVEQYHSRDPFRLIFATLPVATAFQNLNRFDEAEQVFKRLWLLCAQLLKSDHRTLLGVQLEYAKMLRYLGKREKAEELARDALQRLKESRGEESIEFRKLNEASSLSWLHQTSEILQDLDAYYEQVLRSTDDATDEESSNMQVMDIYSTCQVIDAKKVPGFFSRYPAAISVGATDVECALSAVAQEASRPGSRERRRALIRHSNAHGDPFSICHCSAEVERLVLLASIIEVMWIHDDVTEELDHGAACREHSALAEVLKIDVQPSDFTSKNVRQSALATVLRKAIDLDPDKAPRMIETLQDYLANFDIRDDDFDRMEEISSYFIRWGMGIALNDADYESIKQYDFTMGNILGLTNDYFSWNVEKNQTTDRIRNGVSVLIKQHNISPDAAKSLLLGLIVEEESKAARLKEERLKRAISHELSMYFEAIELYVGGSCFWHATAPRYRVFE